MMRSVLVTGSSGLIGRSCVERFHQAGFDVYGVDNNAREIFFGKDARTREDKGFSATKAKRLNEFDIDITDRVAIFDLISRIKPFAIIHTAAQPSHDKAAEIPFLDFETNAVGTLNLIESLRTFNAEGIFVHLSTNKVYGDSPNSLPIIELEKRFDFSDEHFEMGINETQSIDRSMHSLFGVSKLSADILVQEYGRYFGMKTCVLRAGCLTGSNHKGVELHGFLSYLVKCNLSRTPYTIFGYEGKQVRDNLHADDVAEFVLQFVENPKADAVYNLGGGYLNSTSILEAIDTVEGISTIKMQTNYTSHSRRGDHIVYYSDLRKVQADYPSWRVNWNLEKIIESLIRAGHID
jgi:CDP-paratose 2-epimerase